MKTKNENYLLRKHEDLPSGTALILYGCLHGPEGVSFKVKGKKKIYSVPNYKIGLRERAK